MALHNSLEMMHIVWQICCERDQKKQKSLQQNYNQIVYDLQKSWQFKCSDREKLEIESRRLENEVFSPADPEDEVCSLLSRSIWRS